MDYGDLSWVVDLRTMDFTIEISICTRGWWWGFKLWKFREFDSVLEKGCGSEFDMIFWDIFWNILNMTELYCPIMRYTCVEIHITTHITYITGFQSGMLWMIGPPIIGDLESSWLGFFRIWDEWDVGTAGLIMTVILVGGLVAINFIFPYIGNVIIPIDSYFSEVFKPPTSFACLNVRLRMQD